MLKRMVSGIMLTLLVLGMSMLAFNIQPVSAGTITVPDDYPTIQEAINAANPGDTVYVKAGTYYENVIVNKPIALIGENRSTTIIDGGGIRHVISLMADNVNISGFNIRNSGSRYADDSGVHLVGHDHNNISGNMFTDTYVSIYLEHSHNNMISDNVIVATRQWYSIWLRYSHSNIVESNLVINNRGAGIALWSSNTNIVEGNNVTGISTLETADGRGITVYEGSHSNIICNNILVDNRYCGVGLLNAEDNTIQGNVMKCNYLGIYSWKSNNIIIENTILNNDWYGICLYQSYGSIIYHNNFISNTISSSGINTWDNGYPSGGNYWSDHVCTGNPSDGSQPYIIDTNNIDHYPFQDPNGWLLHQLTVTSSPITGITFTINGTTQTTPHTEWLPEGSYTLEMPETYNGYVWSHWLEDGDQNGTKTVTLPGTTWTGVFVSIPVGGYSVPIKGYIAEKPLTLCLALIGILTASFTIAKRRKKQQN